MCPVYHSFSMQTRWETFPTVKFRFLKKYTAMLPENDSQAAVSEPEGAKTVRPDLLDFLNDCLYNLEYTQKTLDTIGLQNPDTAVWQSALLPKRIWKDDPMKLDWKTCFRIGASVFVLYLCIFYWEGLSAFLGTFLSALSPVILGLVIAYVLNILMSFYEKHYFPKQKNKPAVEKSRRPVCMLAAIFTLCGIVALVVGLVVPELTSCVKLLLQSAGPALDKLLDTQLVAQLLPADLLQKLDAVNWTDAVQKVVAFVGSGLAIAADAVVATVASVFSSLVNIFLSIIFAVYLLLGRDKLKAQCKRLLSCYLPKTLNHKILHCLAVINECFHNYIVGQCLEAVILGALCIVGMTIFRFPYAMMIGTLIGFTALIPIAGAYIGAGVGAIMILTQSPVKALLFLLFIVILQQLEGNLIYPKVVGGSIGLPALWVLAAVTVGGSLMGIMGMLLGVPIVAALYRLLREDMEKRENVLKQAK